MIIQHNILSMNANRWFGANTKAIGKNSERLSSGYRINRAADDAAGLSISEKMRSQVRGLKRASNNCEDGVKLVQTADGAMGQAHEILQRMRVLCVQAATDVYTDEDRDKLQMEIDALVDEIDCISTETEYNKGKIFHETYKVTTTTTDPVSGATSTTLPSDSHISAADIPKTGLALVLGSDHITNTGNMTDGITLGQSWKTTGAASSISFKATNASGVDVSNSSLLPPSFRLENNKSGVSPRSGSVNIGGKQLEYSYACYGGSRNPNGIPISLTYTIRDSGGNVVEKGSESMEKFDNEGVAGYADYKYPSAAYVDFSELGTKYQAKDLIGLGFNSGCFTCSDARFNVSFVDSNSDKLSSRTASNIQYGMERKGYGSVNTLYLDVSSITSGADLTKAIVEAAGECGMNNHFTQFAYDPGDASKFYVYDTRFGEARPGGSRAIFEPVIRDENYRPVIPGKITITSGGSAPSKTEYQLGDWYFQTGANEFQGLKERKPILSASVLGINGVLLSDAINSSHCISIVDGALSILSSEQSRLGALQNRLEYADRVDENAEENLQAAESLIRDTNYSDEMTEHSKNTILQQSAQAMLSQANSSKQLVVNLLQS